MEMCNPPVRRKASKFASKDVISSMPENVITNILDRLPIQDAVRTSILSRNWRFKWTVLTQPVFDENFFKYNSPRTQGEKYYNVKNVSRLLLQLKGGITKFVIEIPDSGMLDDEDISPWILFLSRKGIKDFTLEMQNMFVAPIRLPTHLLSCLELTHLTLRNCYFPPMPTFCGFPKLLSLVLCSVHFASCKDWEFIVQCSLLETLKVINLRCTEGFLRLDEIAKLGNLKTLTLTLGILDNMEMTAVSSVFQFISSLQKLQELVLNFMWCSGRFLKEAAAGPKRVPIDFPCLKILILDEVDFSSDSMLACIFETICGSPNLQTLQIRCGINASEENVVHGPPPAICSSKVDCKTLLQLQNVVLEDINGSAREVCFIKFLLASSPILNKMKINSFSSTLPGDIEMFMFVNKLLKLQRDFPMVEIEIF